MNDKDKKQNWRPIDLIRAALLVAAVFVVTYVILSRLNLNKTMPKILILNFVEALCFLGAWFYLQGKYPLSCIDYGFCKDKYRKMLLIGIVGGLFVSIENIKYFYYHATKGLGSDDPNTFVNPSYGALNVVSFITLSVVLLPVIEEILFRGYVYRILKNRYNYIIGGVVTTLIWVIMHMDPKAALYSIILIAIYEYSGSLGSCILAHIMTNAMACINSYMHF